MTPDEIAELRERYDGLRPKYWAAPPRLVLELLDALEAAQAQRKAAEDSLEMWQR